jgi:hypothetical protein
MNIGATPTTPYFETEAIVAGLFQNHSTSMEIFMNI